MRILPASQPRLPLSFSSESPQSTKALWRVRPLALLSVEVAAARVQPEVEVEVRRLAEVVGRSLEEVVGAEEEEEAAAELRMCSRDGRPSF